MSVKIGHASIDENRKAKGGKAGDQTGKEVCIRDWYNKPWTSVIRPKNPNVAEKIAKAMEQACGNNNIGYDQNQRTTLYTQAKIMKWDLSKIKVKCETDCSALVSVCVNCAGIEVSKDIYTGNELNALMKTGKFIAYLSSDYISSSRNLKRGDILLAKGHTAIVLSDGEAIIPITIKQDNTKVELAKSYDKNIAGTYKTTVDLNLRKGAGTNNESLVIIPSGTKVKNYGYYTEVNGTKWLYIQVSVKGVTYTGYSSKKYLVK